MPLTINQLINNRYLIQALLGQGGMGSVYRAYDHNLDRVVALKERLPDPNAPTQAVAQARDQFKREAKVLANLNHPNLPRVTDYFTWGGNEYLVMDFVEGQNLYDLVRQKGAQPEVTVLTWMQQLLAALNYLHSQTLPIIHRDIKPQNVILTPKDRVMLVDFGLVKLLDPTNPATGTGMRGTGTPCYAPLEQYATSTSHTDVRTDIYALGATLYYLLTAYEPSEVHDRLLNPHVPPSPRAINPRISGQLDGVVIKAMELYQQNRYQSASEMRRALDPQLALVACPRCNRGNLPGEIYCQYCAHRLTAEWYCSRCGTAVLPGAAVCVKCGRRL